MARTWLRLFAGATLSLTVAGHALADEGKITVFAAASLTNAMQDIATQYKKEKNVDVVSSFASSSTPLDHGLAETRVDGRAVLEPLRVGRNRLRALRGCLILVVDD